MKIAKEPWQMTRDEFITKGLAKDEAVKRNIGQTLNLPMARQQWGAQHETLVKDALREGKPVPAEVLKDYPDFAKVILQTKPVELTWDNLHFQSRQEVLRGAGMRNEEANKKWSEFPEWQQKLLKDSLKDRSHGRALLNPKSATQAKKEILAGTYFEKIAKVNKTPVHHPPAQPIIRSKIKHYTLEERYPFTTVELKLTEKERSNRAQTMDETRTNKQTINLGNPKIKRWIKDPGSMDIKGIDTPSAPKIKLLRPLKGLGLQPYPPKFRPRLKRRKFRRRGRIVY